MDMMIQDNICAHVLDVGAHLVAGLEALQYVMPFVYDVNLS